MIKLNILIVLFICLVTINFNYVSSQRGDQFASMVDPWPLDSEGNPLPEDSEGFPIFPSSTDDSSSNVVGTSEEIGSSNSIVESSSVIGSSISSSEGSGSVAIDNDVIYLTYHRFNDCTGGETAWFVYNYQRFYSQILSADISCNGTVSPLECNITANYDGAIYNYNIKEGECMGGKTIRSVKESTVVINDTNQCVLAEYTTNTCQYKPVLYFGTLNDVCAGGWNVDCKSPNYTIKLCTLKVTPLKDATQYLVNGTTVTAQLDVCLEDPEQGRKMKGRWYIGEPTSVSGDNDPVIDRVLTNPNKTLESSDSSFSFDGSHSSSNSGSNSSSDSSFLDLSSSSSAENSTISSIRFNIYLILIICLFLLTLLQ